MTEYIDLKSGIVSVLESLTNFPVKVRHTSHHINLLQTDARSYGI